MIQSLRSIFNSVFQDTGALRTTSNSLTILGEELISVGQTVETFTIPTDANYARVQVLSGSAVYTLTGTDPVGAGSSPDGFVESGQFIVDGNLASFKVINLSGTGNIDLYVEYSQK